MTRTLIKKIKHLKTKKKKTKKENNLQYNQRYNKGNIFCWKTEKNPKQLFHFMLFFFL